MRVEVGILTRPPCPLHVAGAYRWARHELDVAVYQHRHERANSLGPASWTRGHAGVTSSLLKGLRQCKVNFAYNPILLKKITGTPLVVLSDDHGLTAAARARSRGIVPFLAVGPNLTTMPDDLRDLGVLDAVDRILVPSAWVARLHENAFPESAERIQVWHAGTDTDFWAPGPSSTFTGTLPLVYCKTDQLEIVRGVSKLLRSLGLKFRLLTYGTHTRGHYRDALRASSFMVYIGSSESQGLALQESWAVGVPTYVFRPSEATIRLPRGRTLRLTQDEFSPAPLLTEATGTMWRDLKDLGDLLASKTAMPNSPRSWVLKNLTLRDAARALLTTVASV